MTREEMLRKMELSDHDFRDYVAKSKRFRDSLNEAQLRFHLSSKSSPIHVEDAAKAFGPDVTVDQLTELFAEAPIFGGVIVGVNTCCGKRYEGPLPPRPEEP